MISAFEKPGLALFFQASLDFIGFCWLRLPWRGVVSITSPRLQLQGVFSSNPQLRTLRSPHVVLDGPSNPSEPHPPAQSTETAPSSPCHMQGSY